MLASRRSQAQRHRQPRVVRSRGMRSFIRSALDAAAAALLFVLFTGATVGSSACACPFSMAFAGIERAAKPVSISAVADSTPMPVIEIATTTSAAPDAVFRRTSTTAAWTLLGTAFSLLAAFNLFIFRHLRRAYAPSRRRGNH